MLFNMLVTVACWVFVVSIFVVNIAIVTHDLAFIVALQLFVMLSATNSETTLGESLVFLVLKSSSATRQTTTAVTTAALHPERLQQKKEGGHYWATRWV